MPARRISFGLETLVEGGALEPLNAAALLRDQLAEASQVEIVLVSGHDPEKTPPQAQSWTRLPGAGNARDASLRVGDFSLSSLTATPPQSNTL